MHLCCPLVSCLITLTTSATENWLFIPSLHATVAMFLTWQGPLMILRVVFPFMGNLTSEILAGVLWLPPPPLALGVLRLPPPLS